MRDLQLCLGEIFVSLVCFLKRNENISASALTIKVRDGVFKKIYIQSPASYKFYHIPLLGVGPDREYGVRR